MISLNRLLISGFILLLCGLRSAAQYNEVGLMIGISSYKGELNEHIFNRDFNHLAFGGFFRHNWNRHWSWKLAVNYGKISGDDALAESGFANDRNLSFHSNILEVSPQVEFNFFPYETGNPYYRFSPYIFTGLAFFHFNPKADLGGETYELQPLTTEGQSSPYRRFQVALPIGGGIKFSVGRIGIGLEVGARRTYTDYLDDVSTVYPDFARLQSEKGTTAVLLSDRSYSSRDSAAIFPVTGKHRGNEQDKDWYLFGGITLSFRLTSILKDICKPFKKRRYI